MRKTLALLCGTALALFTATPAAAVTTFTDSGAFTSTTGASSYDFSFAPPDEILGTTYAVGPATFGATHLNGYNDGDYGVGISYLGAVDLSSLTVTTAASAIGFYFGSWNGPQTITYTLDGISGAFDVPSRSDTAFLGFSGLSGTTSLTFTNNGELDTISFLAAAGPAPEPAVWAMMLVGFGMVGAGMRRRTSLYPARY